MLSYPARLLFFFTMLMGILISTSSTSWLACWIGLELNLMSFIPILSSTINLYKSEAALKYFLIQALGSIIILCWAPMLFMMKQEQADMMFLLAILLKLGASPFHMWLPAVMQGLTWIQCLLLMTLQKMAPLMLLSYLSISPKIIIFFCLGSIFSTWVGGISGMNQTLLRKIMAYSSISHMGWMLSLTPFSIWGTVNYFLIYSIVTTSVVCIFQCNQIFHISNIFTNPFPNILVQVSLFLTLLSLAGLPPFLGFFPKLFTLNLLMDRNNIIWASSITMSTLITLYFYLRISLSTMTLSTPKLKFNLNFSNPLQSFQLMSSVINFFPIFGPLLTLPSF